GVALVPVGLGVADQVEPVPSPSLSIGGTRQQLVDERLDAGGILEKRFLLGGGRGQAIEIEVETAHQSAGFGRGGGLPAASLQPGEDERIDRIADPVAL